jgi:hypothetical protein
MRFPTATLALAGSLLTLASCSSPSSIESGSRRTTVSIDALDPLEVSFPTARSPDRGVTSGGGPAPEEVSVSTNLPRNARVAEATPRPATASIEREAPSSQERTPRHEPRLVPQDSSGGVGVPPARARDFRLVDVTFASKIFGPGNYVPLSGRRFHAGERILIYGEFAGFAEEVLSRAERQRSFSGTLRLVNPEGDILDSIDFLTESAGVSRSAPSIDAVNFWARYNLAADLPIGRYELHIIGRDHVASKESRVSLAVRVVENEPVEALEDTPADTPKVELSDDSPLASIESAAYSDRPAPRTRNDAPRTRSAQSSPKRRAVPMSLDKKSTVDSP